MYKTHVHILQMTRELMMDINVDKCMYKTHVHILQTTRELMMDINVDECK